jgi:hypothetical protein
MNTELQSRTAVALALAAGLAAATLVAPAGAQGVSAPAGAQTVAAPSGEQTVAAPSGAQTNATPPAAEEATADSSKDGPSKSFWQLEWGLRTTFVTDPGFDPFATTNALAQVSFGATRTLWQHEDLSFAPGITWDYGERRATARGDESLLEIHRLSIPLEGRYHLLNGVYVFARLAPGALHEHAVVKDAMAPGPLEDAHWAFALDTSGGAAILLGPERSTSRARLRFWALAEGGYAWTERKTLTLRPQIDADDTRPVGDLPLGSLALGGGFLRLALAATY